jgi:hypothetical protein
MTTRISYSLIIGLISVLTLASIALVPFEIIQLTLDLCLYCVIIDRQRKRL